MTSIWNVPSSAHVAEAFPRLSKELEVDVVVVGAGMTGLSTALHLAEAGRRIAVVEGRQIGASSTGGSTGNLYGTFSQGLLSLRKKWSEADVARAVALRSEALHRIENTVRRFNIDCAFKRQPLYFCAPAGNGEKDEMIAAEYDYALAAGLEAELVDSVPQLPIGIGRVLRIANQAQFNPLHYVQGLARQLNQMDVPIFEESTVFSVDAGEYQVKTEAGTINASDIVLATHTPKGINLLQSEMDAYREYGVAARLSDGEFAPEGIVWMQDAFHSLRSYQQGNDRYIIAVGEKHETGHHHEGKHHYDNLRRYLNRFWSHLEFTHAWSAQQYRSADLMPYIGRSGHDNVYVATGFAADGLIWGDVAGAILGDLILGRENAAAEHYNPRRFTPVKSAKHWAETNMKVGKHFLTDRFSAEKLRSLEDLRIGEGKIVKLDGEKVAAYRAPDSSLTLLSPVCPHMKCYVNWNPEDSTWDCPCHGSRFDTDGSVLEGPAYAGLERIR